MALSVTGFKDCRNFSLDNVRVTVTNNNTSHDLVSTILREAVASGAIFDSAERFASGKCHPGTRKRVIEKITTWVNDPDPAAQRMLWINGPAGAGKSSVAHTICELLNESHPAQYGGSFFFAKDSPDRGNALKLFTTLAYQLAIQFPSMRTELNDVLHRDPSLPTKSMEIQLLSLIAQPLLSFQTLSFPNPVLIIDGLDECADDEGLDTQRTIINLIARSIVERNIPLRFIIASRPEAWIRAAFKASPLPDITLPLSLRNDVDAGEDIRAYLTDEFEKIRLENLRLMGSVQQPWPPTYIIDHFAYEASGQYVYASTVLKFVGKAKFKDPQEQLRILTSPGPHRALAFSELDRLYTAILSAYPQWETMKRVLGGILVKASINIIEVLLSVGPNEIVLVLDALSSLIEIDDAHHHYWSNSWQRQGSEPSEANCQIKSILGSPLTHRRCFKFSHLSFCEFLQTQDRSGTFYIDDVAVKGQILKEFFGLFHRNLDQNYEKEPRSFLNIGIPTYDAVMADMNSWLRLGRGLWDPDFVQVVPHITCMAERLLVLDPIGNPMNYLSCFLQDMEWMMMRFSSKYFSEPQFPDEREIDCQKLSDAASLACKRAVSALSGPFLATPTLVFLTELYYPISIPCIWIEPLLEHPGITLDDVLYTIEQNPNIMHLTTRDDHHGQPEHHACWYLYTSMGQDTWEDSLYQENGEDKEWRIEGKWRDLRFFFAYQFLERGLHKPIDLLCPASIVGERFLKKGVSDIRNKEYFQSADSLKLLALMADISVWTTLRFSPESQFLCTFEYFISNVLCWFNRQLTNMQTLRLLNGHDETLPQKMTRVANRIFDLEVLPSVTDHYSKGLGVSVWKTPNWHHDRVTISIKIFVLPLPQGIYLKEIIGQNFKYDDSWQLFHDQLFQGKEDSTRRDFVPSVIDRSRWHPHLASFLLKAVVALLYCQYTSQILASSSLPEQSFSYIIDCLPYAHTTEENLNAFRAIAYLLPNVTLPWHVRVPANFWFSSVEFLKKYDRSVLSYDELNLFEWWMYSMARYTKRYYPAVAGGPGESESSPNW